MVEAGAQNLSEKEMLEAILFGHEEIKKLCAFQAKIIKEIGIEKVELPLAELDENLVKSVEEYAADDILKAIQIKDKLESYAKVDEIKASTIEHFAESYQEDENLDDILKSVNKILEDSSRW